MVCFEACWTPLPRSVSQCPSGGSMYEYILHNTETQLYPWFYANVRMCVQNRAATEGLEIWCMSKDSQQYNSQHTLIPRKLQLSCFCLFFVCFFISLWLLDVPEVKISINKGQPAASKKCGRQKDIDTNIALGIEIRLDVRLIFQSVSQRPFFPVTVAS